MAKDQTPPTGPSMAQPPAPLDTAAILARLDEMEARHEAEKDELREEITRLQSALTSAAPAATAQPFPFVTREQMLDKQRRKSESRDAITARAEKELQVGPKAFKVSMKDGDARMARVVRAANEHEARAKYEAFFGIRGIVDPRQSIQVQAA